MNNKDGKDPNPNPNPNPAPQDNPNPNPNPDPAPKDNNSVDTKALQDKINQYEAYYGEHQDFVNKATIVLEAIEKNPELKEKLKAQIQGGKTDDKMTDNKDNPQPNIADQFKPEIDQLKGQVQSLDATSRSQIIADFYSETGLSKVDETRRREISKKIEQKLNSWGHSVATTSPALLTNLLKDALVTAGISDEDKAELAKTRANDQARMPNLGGGSGGAGGDSDGDIVLSEDQKKLAKMWGLDEEKMKARIREERQGIYENTIEKK